MQPEAEVGKLLDDLRVPVAVGADAVQVLLAHVEGRDSESSEQPLERARAQEIRAGAGEVGLEGAQGLDGVDVDQRSPGVGELGESLQIVPVAVSIRDPGDGDETRAVVDSRSEVLDSRPAPALRGDAELDPFVRSSSR